MASHSCKMMDYFVFENDKDFNNPDKLIQYVEKFDEYGLPIRDGGGSKVIIYYCPWCGQKLPESKLDEYMEELEKLGIYSLGDENIPDRLQRIDWWKK